MKEHPILFSGEMIKAILNGRKSQTRRVIKPQPDNPVALGYWQSDDDGSWAWSYQTPVRSDPKLLVWNDRRLLGSGQCPYGVPGDRLWVREGYQIRGNIECVQIVQGQYLAESARFKKSLLSMEYAKWERRKHPFRATPGRFMYRSLSRITLDVKRVWVERVQDITGEDAQAEGVSHPAYADPTSPCPSGFKGAFFELWNDINAKRGYGWNVNPWCWCVEFRRHK